MANRFYMVKVGGTKSAGNVATLPTGSFATLGAGNYYNSIQDVVNLGMGNQEFEEHIVCSHLHTETLTAALSVNTQGSNAGGSIMSVDDTDIHMPKQGATIILGSFTWNVSYAHYYHGINITQNGGGIVAYVSNDHAIWVNSTHLITDGNTRFLYMASDGCSAEYFNCVWDATGGSSSVGEAMQIRNGGRVVMDNVTVTGKDRLIGGGFTNGGGTVIAKGCDFSGIKDYLVFGTLGSGTADDISMVYIDSCKLHPSLIGYVQETIYIPRFGEVVVARSGTTSAPAVEFQYHKAMMAGTVDSDPAVIRRESTAFPSSNSKFSYKATTVTTASRISLPFPVRFLLPTRYVKLSNVDRNKVRIYFTSTDATLTENDVYFGFTHRTSADVTLSNHAYSGSGRAQLATAGIASLVDSVSVWTDAGDTPLTGYTQYYAEVDAATTGTPADGPITIEVYVSKFNTVVWVDNELGFG